MNSQAKQQECLILDKILNIQTDVHKNSKRKRSSKISLKEENDAIRKTKRIKIREDAFTLTINYDDDILLNPPQITKNRICNHRTTNTST